MTAGIPNVLSDHYKIPQNNYFEGFYNGQTIHWVSLLSRIVIIFFLLHFTVNLSFKSTHRQVQELNYPKQSQIFISHTLKVKKESGLESYFLNYSTLYILIALKVNNKGSPLFPIAHLDLLPKSYARLHKVVLDVYWILRDSFQIVINNTHRSKCYYLISNGLAEWGTGSYGITASKI